MPVAEKCRIIRRHAERSISPLGRLLQAITDGDVAGLFVSDPNSSLAASAAWRHVADQLRTRFPKLATLMDEAENEVLAYKGFPAAHWAKIHSTNPIERLNKEVKRRADVVGIFPNEASITRLVGAILLEQNDEWQLQHRYMTLETITGMTDDLSISLTATLTSATKPGDEATAH